MRPRSGSLRVAEKVAALGLSVLVIAALLIWSVGGAGPPTAALASTATTTTGAGSGYWLAGADGGVFNFGVAQFDGSGGSLHLRAPIVGMATTPGGGGYWLVASDGGVFTFGDAVFHGSTGGLRLNKPIVGMAATPDGGGYWLVASDGGVFTYGDAVFHGSTGGLRLNKPIVGMAATRDGGGYWLVASDGGVFTYGDAVFHGSTGGLRLNKPIVGMAATPDGGGYWLVASDGGVFTYGDAVFHGSTGGLRLNKPIVGMAATPGDGYWLVASDGGVFTFGDAMFRGSTGSLSLNAPVVAAAGDQAGLAPAMAPADGSTPPFATSVSPPLATSLSASHTYLVDQLGNPFLVNGDSAWNLAFALDSTDQTTYLKDRHSDGFNTVVTDLVGNSTNFGRSNGSNYNGEVPFTDGNFATPNPAYWSKIDTFFHSAETQGITVFAIPIDAYATQGGNVFNTMTNAQAKAFGQWLANRYPPSQYPGIVWMLGNDYAGDGAGADNGGFLSQYQALVSGLGTVRPVTIEQGFYESLSTDGRGLGPLMSINAAYSYHPTYEVIERGRTTESIPVVFFEGAYENPLTGFPATPLDLRKQLGWSMTSGGAGTFYGNDKLWEFQSGWQNQLDTSDVAQRKALNAAFAGVNWQNLHPDVNSQLVVSGRNSEFTNWSTSNSPDTNDPTYGNYVSAAYSTDGALGVIYNPDTTKNRITISNSVLGADPSITAVDPTDGARTSLGWTTTPTMGTNAGGDHDWLFIITASPKA